MATEKKEATTQRPSVSRRRFLKYGAGVVVVGAAAAGGYYYLTTSPATPPTPLQKEKVLVMAVGSDPPYLVNVFSTTPAVTHVAVPLFNALLTYDPKTYEPKGDLAESWSVSQDGLTWTFKLRQNVKWHDGTQFTSADVKFCFEEGILKYHPRGSVFFKPLIDSIQTIDDYTVVLKLKKTSGAFIHALGLEMAPIGLAKHLYQGTDAPQNPNNIAPVGTGPYKFVKWDRGTEIVYEKNANYFKKGMPYLDRVIIRIIPDETARIAALQSGEVDYIPYWYMSADQAARFVNDPKYIVEHELVPVVMILGLNQDKPPLNNLKVRQPIAHAIDKKEVSELATFGLGQPIPNLMSPMYQQFWWPDAPTYAFDRAKAEALLDEAGYPKGQDGKRFELDLWAFPSQTIPKACEVIREQLARVGIVVKVVNVDNAAWTNQIFKTRDWQMHVVTYLYGMDPILGMHRLLDSRVIGLAFQNNFPYKNPEVDKLLDAAATEMDQAKRVAIYKQIQILFNNDLPFITLTDYAVVNMNLWSSKFTDVVNYPVRSHENLENVKLA